MSEFYGETISGKAAALALGVSHDSIGNYVAQKKIDRIAYNKYCIESVVNYAIERKSQEMCKGSTTEPKTNRKQNFINLESLEGSEKSITFNFNTEYAKNKFLKLLIETNMYFVNKSSSDKYIKGEDNHKIQNHNEQCLHENYPEMILNG